jgi:5-methylcytosine-specific restriction endonuclease McrA
VSKRNPYDAHHRMLRALVLASAHHKCHWCGGVATEADHLVAVINGGANELSNYVASCKPCNVRRGNATRAEHQRAMSFRTSRRW